MIFEHGGVQGVSCESPDCWQVVILSYSRLVGLMKDQELFSRG